MHFIRTIPQLIGAMSLSFLLALPVFALDLSQAKSSGQVGETNSGYIAAIKPSGEVEALVTSINSQRKAQYQKIAKKNDITLQAVEARAGVKALQKTQAGEYINTGTGWQVK